MSGETFVLYRFFDSDDVLLYVGMTRNPARRFGQHGSEKPWWQKVVRIHMEHHKSLHALREAERRAIETERPAHNIHMNNGARPQPTAAMKATPMRRRGIAVGGVYAVGLDSPIARGRLCPVGIVTEADDDGFTMTLYSWLIGSFDLEDVWIPYDSVKTWVRADRMSRREALADGYCKEIAEAGVFRMDPLGEFQTEWERRSAS